jgi:hypothetical protein
LQKYNKLTKIISGGQTGADIAGLKFAREIGIHTSGWAPKGYYTEEGKKPELLKDVYHLIEIDGGTVERTIQNVLDSDGTVVFAEKMSDGSALTIDTCRKFNKPYIVNPGKEEFIEWLEKSNISILNVAGNRESVSPGIEQKVYLFLIDTIIS